jgi:hypothetical protein
VKLKTAKQDRVASKLASERVLQMPYGWVGTHYQLLLLATMMLLTIMTPTKS